MATQYLVRVRNRAGVRQYDIGDFLSLSYSKVVNDVGAFSVQLPGNHQAIDALEKNGQIEIWRYDNDASPPIAPYCDFFGLYRDRDVSHQGDSINGVFTVKGFRQLYFLKCAIDGFSAGTNNRNDFTSVAAESIMKLMVKYNATPLATTANGRMRQRATGAWSDYITTATDTVAGATLTKAFSHRNLLDALQELATLGGLDFDLVKTGAQAWEFRTYTLLGTDLTANVKFSLSWGNMGNPQLTGSGLNESTVALVGGSGEENARTFVVRTGPNFDAIDNDIEIFINASNEVDAALAAVGDARLNELRAADALRFDVLQGAYRYGRDYCAAGAIGDKVTVNYAGVSIAKKIRGAHVSVSGSTGSDKAENVQLDMVTSL